MAINRPYLRPKDLGTTEGRRLAIQVFENSSSVLNRISLTLPLFNNDIFGSAIPACCARYFDLTCLVSSNLSKCASIVIK